MKKFDIIDEKLKIIVKEYQLKGGDDTFATIVDISKPLINYSIKAMKYPSKITKKELQQECMVALYQSIISYDTSHSGKITNYIITAMKNAMIQYIRNEQNIIHISNNRLTVNSKIRKFISDYENSFGITPDENVIIDGLSDKNITLQDIVEYYNTMYMNTYDDIYEKEYATIDDYNEEEDDEDSIKKYLPNFY
jgi:DNA-directed RNA polymerase specialized sigma subunit